ncbi:F-box/WD repeat-containing protein 9 [Solea senegalensis]|uniref:F-box/WD repeat-containing protein 9 n=1 Tax=Solea senegalensis TaxID=28829 RepID=A0AAV6RJ00_SOLSE|nr:F-box/WD repeat-containing protein 9 [Solea senegalensis]XP_043907339.1 F-box/WD repeat-containing protein 9 [Solea senegalensis]XP_043907340.1 F-box/WD repeat-containing protein 9 [Solea senegalensis]XP_043907341.1 F-box/WD repeat-containing protein 9 [Solea senegalensis]KAG7505109.1 F-box/WD repeat-containing protein 9 [Solea senegalensis]
MNESVASTYDEQGGPDPVEQLSKQPPDLECLQPAGHQSSAGVGPSSPLAETSGLLSLPWELIIQIASHLPAQCVTSVLPKVCQALGSVSKDITAWQLRAHKLTGTQTPFPVGPREDFDWPTACLEMEQLINSWTSHTHLLAKHTQEDEEGRNQGRQQQGAVQGEEPVPEGQGDGGGAEVEGARVVALEAACGGGDEGVEVAVESDNGDMQPTPPALECITIQTDHIAQIDSVLLVGGEGTVCATGSRDWNVKLWDLHTNSSGALLHSLGGPRNFSTHQGWVWCLASQGSLLASGGFDSTVRLWDLQSGGAERGLIRAGATVLCLSYQSDVLLAGTFDKRISMYDTRAAEPLVKSLRLHGSAVMCLAADDKYIISGSKDCSVAVFDRRAGKGLKKIQLKSYLLSMSYSGSEVWAGDNNGLLHSYSMQEGTLKPLLQFDVGHKALITGIHRSPGSLYTCSSDSTLKVHVPCAPPRTLCTMYHEAGVNGLSVDAGVLAVATRDMFVEVWRPRK